jgi:acetyl-CoA carboxylase biotin carboxyl carrier protein
MSEHHKPDTELIKSVWAEARDLVRRLEGSTVQRFAVKAGEYEIEIERGLPTAAPTNGMPEAPEMSVPMAVGSANVGPGISPAARGASGVINVEDMDNRIPVLAPLVGTFYASAQPGQKAFADVGDVVEAGQTVCIVEAMKLMNEVAAGEKGKVNEICVKNGDWVEFEQVLMYLDPAE